MHTSSNDEFGFSILQPSQQVQGYEERVRQKDEEISFSRHRHAEQQKARVEELQCARQHWVDVVLLQSLKRQENNEVALKHNLIDRNAVLKLEASAQERMQQLHAKNTHERDAFLRRREAEDNQRAQFLVSLRDRVYHSVDRSLTSPRAVPRVQPPATMSNEVAHRILSQRSQQIDLLPQITAKHKEKMLLIAARHQQKTEEMHKRIAHRETLREQQQERLKAQTAREAERVQHRLVYHALNDERIRNMAWRRKNKLRAEAMDRMEEEERQKQIKNRQLWIAREADDASPLDLVAVQQPESPCMDATISPLTPDLVAP